MSARLLSLFCLSALLALLALGCGTSSDAEEVTEAGEEASAEAGFTAQSMAAGIIWTRPAEEIPGLSQRIIGEGAEAAVLLHRSGQEPPTEVAIYLHGWSPTPPSYREGHIQGLVNRGYAVIYPVYQLPDTPAEETRDNAIQGIRSGLEELGSDPESLIAIGDVTGAAIAFDYAALAPELGLPSPKLLVAMRPGREPDGLIPPADHSEIPADTRILIATSTNHRVPEGWQLIDRMLADTSHIPDANRDLFVAEPDPELSIADAIGDSYSKMERAVSLWLDRNGALGGEAVKGG